MKAFDAMRKGSKEIPDNMPNVGVTITKFFEESREVEILNERKCWEIKNFDLTEGEYEEWVEYHRSLQ